jgi:hypothetical protein
VVLRRSRQKARLPFDPATMAATLKHLAITTLCGACLVMAFVLYAAGRTMAETFGLTLRGSASGLLIGFLAPLAVSVLIAFAVVRKPRAGFAIGALLLAGCLLSEAWLLRDEYRFEREVAARAQQRYSRPRVWPNGASSLVFIPGRGIHSTD